MVDCSEVAGAAQSLAISLLGDLAYVSPWVAHVSPSVIMFARGLIGKEWASLRSKASSAEKAIASAKEKLAEAEEGARFRVLGLFATNYALQSYQRTMARPTCRG